ncbi:MAG: hypothetical protein KF716_32200 [Anaerolineae bacterium]|nr:hypothetical protein [Anaerolineae bacterium]
MSLLMNVEAPKVEDGSKTLKAVSNELHEVFTSDLKKAQQPIDDGAWVGEGQKMFRNEMVDKIYLLVDDLLEAITTFDRAINTTSNDIQSADGKVKSQHVHAAEEAFAAIIK